VILFGIPIYLVRRRISSQIKLEDLDAEPESEPEAEQSPAKMEVTSVHYSGPQLTQEPTITSKTIAVNINPEVSSVTKVKPARKRTVKKVVTEEKTDTKATKGTKVTKKETKVEKKAKPSKTKKTDDAKLVVKVPSRPAKKTVKKPLTKI
jgi:hypothetical protein